MQRCRGRILDVVQEGSADRVYAYLAGPGRAAIHDFVLLCAKAVEAQSSVVLDAEVRQGPME